MKICVLFMATVFLAVACFIDYKWKILPDWITVVIAVLGLYYAQDSKAILPCALGAFGISLLLVLPGWMGFGDAKLFPALSLFFNGWRSFFTFFFLCFLINGIICFIGLLLRKLHKKSEVPMGPAIFISFVVYQIMLSLAAAF